MAKINAHGTHQIGPTLFTERVRPAVFDGDSKTLYYEAWRLRSDGTVQTRIIRTRSLDGEARTTEHRGSAFRNFGKIPRRDGVDLSIDQLRDRLRRRGYVIVKEQWR